MLLRFLILSIFFVGVSFASGFEVGANIKITKTDGKVVSGVIKKIRSNTEFKCYDQNRHYFKIPYEKVVKVTAKKGIKFLNASGSYKHSVVELRLDDGEFIDCGFTNSVTLDVKGKWGKKFPITITDNSRYFSAEIVTFGVEQHEGGIIIELINGDKIRVPVDKKDVRSIIFE